MVAQTRTDHGVWTFFHLHIFTYPQTPLQVAIAGKWKIAGVAEPVDLMVNGSSVTSVQKPFGNEPLMAEIEESVEKFGLHVTLGGFPMKAWLKKEGSDMVLAFSNGGRWSKL